MSFFPFLDENGNVVDGMGGVAGIANGGAGKRGIGCMASTAADLHRSCLRFSHWRVRFGARIKSCNQTTSQGVFW
jgi:hypothetical protein